MIFSRFLNNWCIENVPDNIMNSLSKVDLCVHLFQFTHNYTNSIVRHILKPTFIFPFSLRKILYIKFENSNYRIQIKNLQMEVFWINLNIYVPIFKVHPPKEHKLSLTNICFCIMMQGISFLNFLNAFYILLCNWSDTRSLFEEVILSYFPHWGITADRSSTNVWTVQGGVLSQRFYSNVFFGIFLTRTTVLCGYNLLESKRFTITLKLAISEKH